MLAEGRSLKCGCRRADHQLSSPPVRVHPQRCGSTRCSIQIVGRFARAATDRHNPRRIHDCNQLHGNRQYSLTLRMHSNPINRERSLQQPCTLRVRTTRMRHRENCAAFPPVKVSRRHNFLRKTYRWSCLPAPRAIEAEKDEIRAQSAYQRIARKPSRCRRAIEGPLQGPEAAKRGLHRNKGSHAGRSVLVTVRLRTRRVVFRPVPSTSCVAHTRSAGMSQDALGEVPSRRRCPL